MTKTRVNSAGAASLLNSSLFNRLRKADLSVTSARLAVLEQMNASGEMMDAVQVHRRLTQGGTNFPLSSLYVTLSTLHRAGLLSRRVYAGQSALYGLAGVQCASRLMCRLCGRIPWVDDARITALIGAVCQEQGFTVDDYTLSIGVVCESGECVDSRHKARPKAANEITLPSTSNR